MSFASRRSTPVARPSNLLPSRNAAQCSGQNSFALRGQAAAGNRSAVGMQRMSHVNSKDTARKADMLILHNNNFVSVLTNTTRVLHGTSAPVLRLVQFVHAQQQVQVLLHHCLYARAVEARAPARGRHRAVKSTYGNVG